MAAPAQLGSAGRIALAVILFQSACGGGGSDGPTVPPPPPPAPTTGSVAIELRGTGNSRDADGVLVSLGSSTVRSPVGATVRFDTLSPGARVVRVSDVAPHCRATPDSLLPTVRVGATETLTVDVSCIGGFAYLDLTVGSSAHQIYYLGEDGRTTALTSGPGGKTVGRWSPDGTRLLYTDDESGTAHVYTVRADGTDRRQITSEAGTDVRPRWSPDGTRVAFWHTTTSGGLWVKIVDAAGGIASLPLGTNGSDWDPVWASDGSQLYFSCSRFSSVGLCAAAADGSGLRPVPFTLQGQSAPCTADCPVFPQGWEVSPDGKWIAFVASISGTSSEETWVAAVDGSSARRLTPGLPSSNPKWSPAGDRLVVMVGEFSSTFGVATVNRDGTGYRLLSNLADLEGAGAWSPDGALISFYSTRSKRGENWVMNADGAGARRLTSSGVPVSGPVWNPKVRAAGLLLSRQVPSPP